MKLIKAFCTNDKFIDNNLNTVAPIFEISDLSLTFAKHKQTFTFTEDRSYSLILFHVENGTTLSPSESETIFSVVTEFNTLLTTASITNKSQLIQMFISGFNRTRTVGQLTSFNYNTTIERLGTRTSDSISFRIDNTFEAYVWLADSYFRSFYPNYEIDLILPVENFSTLINRPAEFVQALDNFNIVDFNTRIEQAKNFTINTITIILLIPYKIPNTSIFKKAYFAFNIYGQQGNYEFILRLKLFDHLVNNLNLREDFVETIFPSILNINEFFVIPRWDNIAIPSFVGRSAINSQVQRTFRDDIDIQKFIPNIQDIIFLKNNTNSVPIDYNNLMLHIVNGYYSEEHLRDFRALYSDIITVFSKHPDFNRMSRETQHILTLLENALVVSDVDNSIELLNNIIANTNFNFRILRRMNVEYLTIFNDKHQFYILPKYELFKLNHY